MTQADKIISAKKKVNRRIFVSSHCMSRISFWRFHCRRYTLVHKLSWGGVRVAPRRRTAVDNQCHSIFKAEPQRVVIISSVAFRTTLLLKTSLLRAASAESCGDQKYQNAGVYKVIQNIEYGVRPINPVGRQVQRATEFRQPVKNKGEHEHVHQVDD